MISSDRAGMRVIRNETDNWLEVTGRGHITSHHFVEYQIGIRTLLAQKKAGAMLLDAREINAISPVIQHKMNTETLPDLISGGITCIAILTPFHGTALRSLEKLVEAAFAHGIRTQFFMAMGPAQEWLRARQTADQ